MNSIYSQEVENIKDETSQTLVEEEEEEEEEGRLAKILQRRRCDG
jgi:hypothetical protein